MAVQSERCLMVRLRAGLRISGIPMLSVTEWADGLLLTAQEMGVKHLSDLDTEMVIARLIKLGRSDGIHFEGSGQDCGGQTFHLGGAEVFCWEPDEEDDNGNLCVLIELVEDN